MSHAENGVNQDACAAAAFSAPKNADGMFIQTIGVECTRSRRYRSPGTNAVKRNSLPACRSAKRCDYLIFEIIRLGIGSNLRAHPPESNVLVRPESFGRQRHRPMWKSVALGLASRVSLNLRSSDQDGVFWPDLFCSVLASPPRCEIPKRWRVVGTSCEQQLVALTCATCPTSRHHTVYGRSVLLTVLLMMFSSAVMCHEAVDLVV